MKTRLVLSAFAMTLTLAGCGGQPEESMETEAAAPAAEAPSGEPKGETEEFGVEYSMYELSEIGAIDKLKVRYEAIQKGVI